MRKITYILISIMIMSVYGYSVGMEKKEYIDAIKEKAKSILLESLRLTNGKLEYEWVGEAIMGLGYTRDKKYLNLLRVFLKDERLKKYAITGLSLMRMEEAERILVKEYNKEKSFPLKMDIAFALVESGRTEYIQELIKSFHSKDERTINEVLFYLRLIDLNKDNLYEKYKISEEIDELLDRRGYKTNYRVFVNALKVLASAKDKKFEKGVEKLFAIDNYDMHYDAIQIAENYLSETNDIYFYSNLVSKFNKMFRSSDYKEIINKINMARLLYRYSHNEVEGRKYLDYIKGFEKENNFITSLHLTLSGNYKYISEGLKGKTGWSTALRSIRFNLIYEAKEDLLEVLRKGIPKQWENTQDVEHKTHIIMFIIKTLGMTIFSKSADVYTDIKDLEFCLSYKGLLEGYNEYVRMETAIVIYHLIWSFEIGAIPSERFWGK